MDELERVELQQVSERLARAVRRLERMVEIGRELASTVELEPLLYQIVAAAAELTGSESASILLLDGATGELRFRAASGTSVDQLIDIPVPVDDSIAGAVLRSGQPAVVSDTHADRRHYRAVGEQAGVMVDSLLAVPLRIKERSIGVLEAINKPDGGQFTPDDVETLETLAAQAAVAIDTAQMVEDLQSAYARLGELDRIKSDLIAIASHELRTPLSIIMGYASMLREQLSGSAAPQLEAVWRAATRLHQVIEMMLNLRYLETGEAELTCTTFDLGEEVVAACEVYRSLAEANGLTLVVQTPEQRLTICADRDKLRLAVDNLLSNALKFTPWGGRVRVTLAQRGDWIEIAVADTGVGIPPDALERVFEPFRQVEEHLTRHHEGLGLGLPIAKGLVELHGGQMRAESILGRGSRFVMLLPTAQPE